MKAVNLILIQRNAHQPLAGRVARHQRLAERVHRARTLRPKTEKHEADPSASLIPQQIPVNEFRKEQLKDEFAKQLLEKLAHAYLNAQKAQRPAVVLYFDSLLAALDGVLHRVTDASDPGGLRFGQNLCASVVGTQARIDKKQPR